MSSLVDYLGGHVSALLALPPFSAWEVTKSIEEDIPKKEVWYEFEGHGVEVICDEAERIRTIFLRRGDGEALSGVPFGLSRREVLHRFGSPRRAELLYGFRCSATQEPGTGLLFQRARFTFNTRSTATRFDMITLMGRDVEP